MAIDRRIGVRTAGAGAGAGAGADADAGASAGADAFSAPYQKLRQNLAHQSPYRDDPPIAFFTHRKYCLIYINVIILNIYFS